MEFTLLFAALAGVGAMWLAARLANRSQRPGIPDNAFELLVNATVIGLVVGRVWAMVAAGSNPLANLGDLIIVRGGVDPLGASLGSIGALLWTTRTEGLSALDGLAPVALWGLAGWHAGCVLTGACLGATSSLPWALTEPGSDIARHPVELYAALILGVGAIVLGRLRTSHAGVTAALALLVASGARLVTEPLRLSLGTGRAGLYLVGAAVAAIAALIARRVGPPGLVNPGPTSERE